ncbi:MAG: hypothetical protein LC802_13495 [Acidobacteria bacterium]|nr:hypothetical protein [Acidobacteriota bacterium]
MNLKPMTKRTHAFAFGFLAGLTLIVAANLYSYQRMRITSVLINASVSFGVPFVLWHEGGFSGSVVLWGNLLANVFVAVLTGLALGWACQRCRRRVAVCANVDSERAEL